MALYSSSSRKSFSFFSNFFISLSLLGLRRRIELIQDFEMPAVSNCIRLSSDGHYILATGIYKPRVRCYDVDNLAMKFERCFDSEVISFEILSDDYSKVLTFFF